MNKNELLNKLNQELPLTEAEQAFLDELLTSEAQQTVSKFVQDSPEEDLNLQWRASLNEKLHVESLKRRKRQRISWSLRPALGLACAAALASIYLVNQPELIPAPKAKASVESKIFAAHEQTSNLMELEGKAVSNYETKSHENDNDYQWEESDLGAL